jgi:putative membrane-bound dehydrogenase-like protein
LLFTVVMAAVWVRAEDAERPHDFSGELPRIAPREPAEALAAFQVARGFRVELAAAEPLVHDPVAMSFDERGRLYVVEMCDYSEQDHDFLGVVRLLTDTDGDGAFERSAVFADKFSWPTAVICYDGGVFVGAAPDIWYLKDHDGDGRADERRKVFTGFGRDNVQGLLNSFTWGLDNRIYGATSSSGGEVRREDRPDSKPVSLRGRDFAFDPRTLELTAESGGAQHGASFDDWGRRFVCSNSDHIQLIMFEDRYVARNPLFAAPNPRLSIASDGPQAEVYRISPVEPWRIVRTRLRISGAVPGIVEGGGRAAGYFTSATGVTIYRGDAWPVEYRGNAFVGDVGSNIVHRKRLEPDGVELRAQRAEADVEFIASRDIWFRPAQFANGPDGNLYLADVYREVIEHPASLPPIIKQHLDLTSGRDRGRIYRVCVETTPRRSIPSLDRESSTKLVSRLASDNAWDRETAARLLFERQDRAITPLLRDLTRTSDSALGRMHAMYTLAGLQALDANTLLARLSDKHPRVREHAVRLCEPYLAAEPELVARLIEMTKDPDARVRYQLAFTLGEAPIERRIEPLVELAVKDGSDRWMAMAIQSSLTTGAVDFVEALIARADNAELELLHGIALQIARSGHEDDIVRTLKSLTRQAGTHRLQALAVLTALAEGYSNGRLRGLIVQRQMTEVESLIEQIGNEAQEIVRDRTRSTEARIEALGRLDFASADDILPSVARLIDPREPQVLQLAALDRLKKSNSDEAITILIGAWPSMGPTVRNAALEVLLSRSASARQTLEAVAEGRILARDLDVARKKQLISHREASIRERAQALLSEPSTSGRAEVLAAYRSAIELPGDTAAGRQVFVKTCASCHKLDGTGHEIGPNLATIQNRGAEAILANVLDPNREVNPQFLSYFVVTNDGRTLTGMIQAETGTSITLVRADNQSDLVLRSEIESLESTGVSLMPEGLEKDLTPQAMADLIAYLLSVR